MDVGVMDLVMLLKARVEGIERIAEGLRKCDREKSNRLAEYLFEKLREWTRGRDLSMGEAVIAMAALVYNVLLAGEEAGGGEASAWLDVLYYLVSANLHERAVERRRAGIAG